MSSAPWPSRTVTKRAVDVLVSSVGLLVVLPLLVLLVGAARVAFGPSPIFRQPRAGLHGRPFVLYKIRTMRSTSPDGGTERPDAERLTAFGRWLRRTSLDELPQLWNVLAGSMSVVGPRPLLLEYLPLYDDDQSRRHEAKPGITGWAQVHGRNELSWERKFDLDLWYVDHWSVWLDLKILWLTSLMVLRRTGVEPPGLATAEPFRGTPRD